LLEPIVGRFCTGSWLLPQTLTATIAVPAQTGYPATTLTERARWQAFR